MTNEELTKAIANKTNIEYNDVKKILESMAQVINERLKDGETIKIKNVGTLTRRTTGQGIQIKYIASKTLKKQ